MANEIKGIVRPPMEMPEELRTLRERSKAKPKRSQIPLLIRLFSWYCVLRAVAYFVFALIMGFAPQSDTAAYLASHFNPFPPPIPPEIIFFGLMILYTVIAWRWMSGDWRARWGAMCVTGGVAARALVWVIADHAVGNPTPMTAGQSQALTMGIVINLIVFAFLAFYPGMEQAFKETPWD